MKRLLASLLIVGMPFSAAVYAAGDAGVGAVKGQTCLGCHGVKNYNNAYPTYHVPKLGGQHAGYLVAAMKAYKAGTRTHETMYGNVVDLSDQDMQDIAAYFEQDGK
ncbi:MAG: cytochrome c [Cycloclasticus sp.]|jgi:cytochrome c553|nr:cytochrome c [Cycloclasticus sp.]MDF1689100.1 cytochrome c [Cycloclasticus sp.]MEE4292012.1 cytochrome c [Cycloclasticus sp.]